MHDEKTDVAPNEQFAAEMERTAKEAEARLDHLHRQVETHEEIRDGALAALQTISESRKVRAAEREGNRVLPVDPSLERIAGV